MDKKIALIIGGIVVLVIVGAGAFAFMNKDSDTTNSTTTMNETNSSESEANNEDLGLCDIVDVATIKSALGSAADTLTGPNNTGVISLGDGDKGQTCVYPFVEGASASNSFYTDLAQYTEASYDNVADFTATSGETVSGVGDRATFKSSEAFMNAKEFSITAVKGANVYKFVISQPADAVTFDDASAMAALTAIAQAATLK